MVGKGVPVNVHAVVMADVPVSVPWSRTTLNAGNSFVSCNGRDIAGRAHF